MSAVGRYLEVKQKVHCNECVKLECDDKSLIIYENRFWAKWSVNIEQVLILFNNRFIVIEIKSIFNVTINYDRIIEFLPEIFHLISYY